MVMKINWLVILILVGLLSACHAPWNWGRGDKTFIMVMDRETAGHLSYEEFTSYASSVRDIARKEHITKEEISDGKKTIYYKSPSANGNPPYDKLFCYYHIVVDVETDKVIGWGFDMPLGKVQRNVCRTFG